MECGWETIVSDPGELFEGRAAFVIEGETIVPLRNGLDGKWPLHGANDGGTFSFCMEKDRPCTVANFLNF